MTTRHWLPLCVGVMLTGCSDPPAKARPVAPAKTPPTKAVAAERLEELLRAEGAAADAEEYYALAATLRAQVEARPDDADTWTSFGRALCRAALTVGRLHEDDDRALAAADEGISAFEKAVELAPKSLPPLIGLAECVRPADPRRALETARRALTLDPRSDEAAVLAANASLNLSQPGDAVAVLEALLAVVADLPRTRSRRVHEYLGRAYIQLGRLDEAEAILKKAADGIEKEAGEDMYYGCPFQALGALYARQGSLRRAAESYGKAADLEPGRATPQYEAAMLYRVAGDAEKALAYARRAQKLSGSSRITALIKLLEAGEEVSDPPERALDAALYAFGVGDYELADDLTRLSMASGEKPVHRRLLQNIERVRRVDRDLESGPEGPEPDGDPLADALRHFSAGAWDLAGRRVEGADPARDPPAAVLRGFIRLLEQRYADARGDFEAVRRAHSSEPGAAVGLVHVAIAEKKTEGFAAALAAAREGAEEAFSAAGEAERGYLAVVRTMAWLAEGWASANEARHDEAIKAYDRILAEDGGHLFATLGKGNSLSGLGRFDEAEALFERALKTHPDNPYVHAELALVHYNRGDNDAAEKGFRKALELDDERYTCPWEGLGLVFLRRGRTDEAAKSFERAIWINPDIEYKKYNGLARIRLKQGRVEEARKLLEKSIANYPHDDEARQMLARISGE